MGLAGLAAVDLGGVEIDVVCETHLGLVAQELVSGTPGSTYIERGKGSGCNLDVGQYYLSRDRGSVVSM